MSDELVNSPFQGSQWGMCRSADVCGDVRMVWVRLCSSLRLPVYFFLVQSGWFPRAISRKAIFVVFVVGVQFDVYNFHMAQKSKRPLLD